jgi:hypothetical protein
MSDVRQIVVHESAGNTLKGAHRTLSKAGNSVNFAVDEYGKIYECVPLEYRTGHAAPFNEHSIGFEVVNRCVGDVVPDGLKKLGYVMTHPRHRNSNWIVPSNQVLESFYGLLYYHVNVPWHTWSFLNMGEGGWHLWKSSKSEEPQRGSFFCSSHSMWHHSDGGVPLYYVALRFKYSDPTVAYRELIDRMNSVYPLPPPLR